MRYQVTWKIVHLLFYIWKLLSERLREGDLKCLHKIDKIHLFISYFFGSNERIGGHLFGGKMKLECFIAPVLIHSKDIQLNRDDGE